MMQFSKNSQDPAKFAAWLVLNQDLCKRTGLIIVQVAAI
jgi:hypothetical protein